MALEETQEASHFIKIAEPMAKSREQLHTMIRRVIAEELGTPRAPTAAKEGSGESVRPGRHAGTDPAQPDMVAVRGQSQCTHSICVDRVHQCPVRLICKSPVTQSPLHLQALVN